MSEMTDRECIHKIQIALLLDTDEQIVHRVKEAIDEWTISINPKKKGPDIGLTSGDLTGTS